MFDWLQYRYKLARFHAEKTRAHRARARVWRRAAKGKPKDSDLENTKSGRWRDDRLIDDERGQAARVLRRMVAMLRS